MIRKAWLTLAISASVLLVEASAAFAGDPSQIGNKLEDIVSPNVKSFWKIAVLVGAVVSVFGRVKTGLIVAFWVSIALAGMVIYNPGGFADTVNTLGDKLM